MKKNTTRQMAGGGVAESLSENVGQAGWWSNKIVQLKLFKMTRNTQ